VCRKDAQIVAKGSYGRGGGTMKRSDLFGVIGRYIQSSYHTLRPSAHALTGAEKDYLKQWFPARLVDGVYVTEQNWPGPSPFLPASVGAITLGSDLIAIQGGNRTLNLLKHEFVHICQYDKLGTDMFAHTYTNQFVDGGYDYYKISFEVDAIGFQDKPDASTPVIDFYGGSDGSRRDVYSHCQ
jgi:hypothetical protein